MQKKPMPAERQSITRKMKIPQEGGKALKGYITVGLYEDGTPGEIFIMIKRIGEVERGLCHVLGIVISLALQRGVPIYEIADKLCGHKFEPSGFTRDPQIPSVSSIADYIGQWLKLQFPKKEAA